LYIFFLRIVAKIPLLYQKVKGTGCYI
jgi:hypothetical protein